MNKDENKVEYIAEDDGEEKGEKKVKKVKDDLKACHKERAEYLAGWQRAKADYINLEKRTAHEKAEWIKFSNAELILNLLPILDSFEEAIKHDKSGGILQLYNQLKDLLKKEGLEEIKSLGEKFNPELHEVIENEKGDEKEGTITEEIQRGYKLHGKLIRPARIKIK